jgi:beta-glucosidase
MLDRIAVTRRTLLATSMLALAAPAFGAERDIFRDAKAPVAERVRDLLARMTLEEKAAQLRAIWTGKADIMAADASFSPLKAATAIRDGIGQIARPGDRMGASDFVQHRQRDVHGTVEFVNAVQRFLVEGTRLGIPALFHEETAHGLVAADATIFPIPPGLGSTWDPDLVEKAFAVAGREARARGTTVALSPVVDLARDPRYGRVEEFFGEDPYHVAQMSIAAVRGQQGRSRPLADDRVFVTLKHFVHGAPQGGINLAPADNSERDLRENYLVPFEKVIEAVDPAIIMPSYNEVEGVPSHANRALLEATGRTRLGFKGAYFSDYNGVINLVSQHHVAADNDAAALLALNAGVDAELPEGAAYKAIPALVRAGRLAEAKLDEHVARILALKFEAGLFERPYVDAKRAAQSVNRPDAMRLARTVAEKALVLLKNDGVLPLDPSKSRRLAVIGPNAEMPVFGGYSGENAKAGGILAGLRAATHRSEIEYAEGVRLLKSGMAAMTATPADPSDNVPLLAQAVEVASRADVILLVLGDRPEVTRESVRPFMPGDRSTLGLFGEQDRLVEAMIATGKPIIALLLNGRPLAVTRLAEKASALVEGWYLGQAGGQAFADMLFGRINPGGKLAVSFPRSAGELPVYYNRHPSADINQYIEGRSKPLFPFGHGLSYTSFEIAAPRLAKATIALGETVAVEVDVTNIGNRAGDEVVQLYIRDDVSSVPRPVLELKAFQRVSLTPNEKRTIRFELTADDLAFWNIDMEWRVERGDFTILAGNSSSTLQGVKLSVA